MKINANNAGFKAEKLAATFLTQHGLKLVAQNYHCRFGEIDLIMMDGKAVVFVEVRLRSNASFGSASESITPAKQRKLVATAQHYLQTQCDMPCRFDAVLMDSANLAAIEWVRNAFEA